MKGLRVEGVKGLLLGSSSGQLVPLQRPLALVVRQQSFPDPPVVLKASDSCTGSS